MKKSEWIYLASAMWAYSERNEGEISRLLKELVNNINRNKEMIDNDMGKYEQNARSNRPINSNTTGNTDFKGFGEL